MVSFNLRATKYFFDFLLVASKSYLIEGAYC